MSQGGLGVNAGMTTAPLSSAYTKVSTQVGAGYRNANELAPWHIYNNGTAITGATATIVSASITPTSPTVYPCIAWFGVFREDFANRVFLGIIEISIPTPAAGSVVGNNNNVTLQLLNSGSGGTDGRYAANRILTVTSPGTLAVQPIPIQRGWIIGMEVLTGAGGNTTTVNDVNGGFAYTYPVANTSVVTGFTNAHVTILIT